MKCPWCLTELTYMARTPSGLCSNLRCDAYYCSECGAEFRVRVSRPVSPTLLLRVRQLPLLGYTRS